MVRRISSPIKQKPESIEDGGIEKVFSKGSEIPVMNSFAGCLVEEPSEALNLCGREFLGSQGLPIGCGGSRSIAESVNHRGSRTSDAFLASSCGSGPNLSKTDPKRAESSYASATGREPPA